MEGDRDKEENLIKGFPLNEEYNQLREEHGKALSLLNTAINSKIVQFVSDHIFDLVPEPMIGCIYNIKSQRFIKVSKFFYLTLGYTEEEFYSKTVKELIDPECIAETELARKYYATHDGSYKDGFTNKYLNKDRSLSYYVHWFGNNQKINHHYMLTFATITDIKVYNK